MALRVHYDLTAPMIITPRLTPGIRVGDATVGIEPDRVDTDRWGTRTVWRYTIDGAGLSYEAADLCSAYVDDPPTGAEARLRLRSLLGFLSAAADRYRATMGKLPADGWLFSAAVDEWAYLNSDEIDCAADDLAAADGQV